MNAEIRKIVSVRDLPEPLRHGFDPLVPVELVQRSAPALSASQRLRARMAKLDFKRIGSSVEAVARVRRIRDGGPL
ncbi:hypothetical protein [Phreatobacter stygius]|uniref:Uncharacterized protein n=1 Tax=Phreatobacter stygius TaxID=1940610 RepID=A0A4D7B3F2_9HYPH|nr:hypothetical protein [Phreatobacter stygius]QCI65573.1 hypothetical protein E8M01_15970 [Phreatobacter stygius]